MSDGYDSIRDASLESFYKTVSNPSVKAEALLETLSCMNRVANMASSNLIKELNETQKLSANLLDIFEEQVKKYQLVFAACREREDTKDARSFESEEKSYTKMFAAFAIPLGEEKVLAIQQIPYEPQTEPFDFDAFARRAQSIMKHHRHS